MNGRVFRLDVPAHQAVQELLPWYASSQLEPDDAHRVEAHLHTCEQCRQDLQWEREMLDQGSADTAVPPGVDMERAWARLLPALGPVDDIGDVPVRANAAPAGMATIAAAAEAKPPADAPAPAPALPVVPRRWWTMGAANQPTWLRWAVAAQWVLIVGLVALLARPDEPPAAYRVLGNSAGAAPVGNLVVMFQPTTTERELRRILQAQGARMVDGPTVTDAYLISVPEDNRDRALQALRADPAVKFAEALDDGGTP
jgi:hypothetical protein